MISLTPNRTGVYDLSNGISIAACFILLADRWLVVYTFHKTTDRAVSMEAMKQEGAHLSGRRKACFQLGSFRFSPHLAQQVCIVPHDFSCAWMVGAQGLFPDAQGTLVQRLSLLVLALVCV